jgi:hypothetical protein
MSRQYSDSWRPAQNRPTTYPNQYSSHSYNSNKKRRPWIDQDTLNNRADDQIAPKNASQSADSLQRWALKTADLPQYGHRFNETQIFERIERRYASDAMNHNAPFPRYTNDKQEHNEQGETRSSEDLMYHTVAKRGRSISPPSLGRESSQDVSAFSYMRDSKRRRTRSPSLARRHSRAEKVVIDLTEEEGDVDYAQSSEWSFPGSEDEHTHA